MAFDGSGPLVAQAESIAVPLARLKRRATTTLRACRQSTSTTTSDNGAQIFAGPSRTAPRTPRLAVACRGVFGRPPATTSC